MHHLTIYYNVVCVEKVIHETARKVIK